MRPNKIVLCVMSNEQELSVLKFMLETNGYRVIAAPNGNAAIRAFKENAVDLVLAEFALPEMAGDKLIERLKGIAAHIPMILLCAPQVMVGQVQISDAMLSKGTVSSEELLLRIKLMSAKKRGPRKGMQRAVPVVPESAVAV